MKKLILVSLALILSFNAFSQDSGIGIGVILGNPTGFSAKFWMSEKVAVDAAVGATFYSGYYGYGFFRIHGDFLFHNWSFDVAQDVMKVYFGAGAMVGFSSYDFHLGIRVPGGVAYHFHQMPLECFAEVVPRFDVLPGFDFDVDYAVGARWYF